MTEPADSSGDGIGNTVPSVGAGSGSRGEAEEHAAASTACVEAEDWAGAGEAAAKALAVEPLQPVALRNAALAAEKREKPQEAAAHLSRLAQHGLALPLDLVRYGRMLAQCGRDEVALVTLRDASENNPQLSAAHLALADLQMKMGRPWTAIRTLSDALARQPDQTEIRFRLGLFNLRYGRYGAAEQSLRPLDRPGAAARELQALARALAGNGKASEACSLLRAAIDRQPRNILLMNALGQILEERNHLAEARTAYEQVLELAPRNASARKGAGRTVDPLMVFAAVDALLADPGDEEAAQSVADQTGHPADRLREFAEYAREPRLASARGIGQTALEREYLTCIAQARHRQSALPEARERRPVRTAGPHLDPLGQRGNHETWPAVQWICNGVLRQTAPGNDVAVVMSARNEGLYLVEWVAHYRALGCKGIFVYVNDSDDGSEELLTILAQHGYVTFLRNSMDPGESISPQLRGYAHALQLVPEVWEHEWALFIDADEFLVLEPRFSDDVRDLPRSLGEEFEGRVSAIALYWNWCFSGDKLEYEARPLIERFPVFFPRGGAKSMVRVADTLSMHAIHFPHIVPGGAILRTDGSLLPFEMRWNKDCGVSANFKLNHYWCKSFEEFALKKMRGDEMCHRERSWKRELSDFFICNGGETAERHDPVDPAFVARVKDEIGRIMHLPNMQEAMKTVRERSAARVSRFDSEGGLRKVYEQTLASVHPLAMEGRDNS